MARDNYSYQKYRRELAKKKKKEEKMQRKLDKKNMKANEDQGQALNTDAPIMNDPSAIVPEVNKEE